MCFKRRNRCVYMHDPHRTATHIVKEVCQVATAGRTIATKEENRIYTNYEGWLPDEDERPTSVWSNSWDGLIRETYPNVTTSSPNSPHCTDSACTRLRPTGRGPARPPGNSTALIPPTQQPTTAAPPAKVSVKMKREASNSTGTVPRWHPLGL